MQATRKEEGSLTKSDLIEMVADKLRLPKGKAELIVNSVFDCMEESLRRGEHQGFSLDEPGRHKRDLRR